MPGSGTISAPLLLPDELVDDVLELDDVEGRPKLVLNVPMCISPFWVRLPNTAEPWI